LELKEIKAVIDLMNKNGLTEFDLEKADFKIRLKKGGADPIQATYAPAYHAPLQSYTPPVGSAPAAAVAAAPESGPTINSPMVGTLYLAPSPESPNYAPVGTEVNPDTVVCIIEAMKVMNEIKAEVKGVITEILGENGKPVEFGKPLFRIKTL
jgi:acetyl-CoA carboxylase biotin carboxyl carrier protein